MASSAPDLPLTSSPYVVAGVVLGVGVVVSLIAGVVYGLVIDDLARGIGQAGAVGMIIASLVGVLLAYRAGRQSGDLS